MQTKQYTLILMLILCLGAFSSKAYTDLERGKSRPTDSIMDLYYNAATYHSTLDALAKMDKPMAQRLDSAVSYLNNLPASWPMAVTYQSRMPYLRYWRFDGFALMVEQEYMQYVKINAEYPDKPVEQPIQNMVFKPVIYLYPEKEQPVNVNLGFIGTDLYTWPKIDAKNNWNVSAQPDGMLKDAADEEYPYLFWEGKMDDYTWIGRNEGFCVPAQNTETFLLEKLKLLGLNARERTDFITYWAPKLRQNSYNIIRFETTAYAKALPLTITPKPESTQRILMVYKALEEPVVVKEQVLIPFARKGFTVIEWGGMAMPEIVN